MAKAKAKKTVAGMKINFTKKQAKKIQQSMLDSGVRPRDAAKYLTRLSDISEIRATASEMYG